MNENAITSEPDSLYIYPAGKKDTFVFVKPELWIYLRGMVWLAQPLGGYPDHQCHTQYLLNGDSTTSVLFNLVSSHNLGLIQSPTYHFTLI